MGPVERGLLRRRRADLDVSRLAVHARDNSSPGQSPDTSLEGWTHGAWREEDPTVQEDWTLRQFWELQIGKSWDRARGELLLLHARVECDIALDLMS